jgi:hypothetical protein
MVNLGDRFSEVMRLWASPFIRNPIYKFLFEHGLLLQYNDRGADLINHVLTMSDDFLELL